MKDYKIELHFTDVDDNFYTKGRATLKFDVAADDYETAYHLGRRLQHQLQAEDLVIISPIETPDITKEMVNHLRDKTDMPMMECKKALTACRGDMHQAIEWLRTRHLHRTYL